jgi:hypothetical protein
MKVVEHITCAACQRRIRKFEPDIVLLKTGGSEKHFYHTRCEPAATTPWHSRTIARRITSGDSSGYQSKRKDK